MPSQSAVVLGQLVAFARRYIQRILARPALDTLDQLQGLQFLDCVLDIGSVVTAEQTGNFSKALRLVAVADRMKDSRIKATEARSGQFAAAFRLPAHEGG